MPAVRTPIIGFQGIGTVPKNIFGEILEVSVSLADRLRDGAGQN